MSHLPNKLQSASKYTVASNQTIYAGQPVKMISDGIAAINLTSDELSVIDITEQSLEKVLCVVPLSATKHFVIYQNISTGIGYAVIHNISNGIITAATPLSLTNATYKAQCSKLNDSKVCVLIELVNSQKMLILNIDGSDNITSGSEKTFTDYFVNFFDKINDTKIIFGSYLKSQNLPSSEIVSVGIVGLDDEITITESGVFSMAAAYPIKCVVFSSFLYGLIYQTSYNDASLKNSLYDLSIELVSNHKTSVTIEQAYYSDYLNIFGEIMEYKRISSTLAVAITTKTEHYSLDHADFKSTKINLIKISGETISIAHVYVYSETFALEDLRALVLSSNKFIIQRQLQRPTNAEMYKIETDNTITKTQSLAITEINGISSKVWNVDENGNIIEYTLQQGNKTSVKIIKTRQSVPDNIIGFAMQNGTSAEKIFVDCGYEIGGFFGLFQGKTYYLSDVGQLTLVQEQTQMKIGIAISSNKIKRLF